MSVRESIRVGPSTAAVSVQKGISDTFIELDTGATIPLAAVPEGATIPAPDGGLHILVVPRIDSEIAQVSQAEPAAVAQFQAALGAGLSKNVHRAQIARDLSLDSVASQDLPQTLTQLATALVDLETKERAERPRVVGDADSAAIRRGYHRAEVAVEHPALRISNPSEDSLVRVLEAIGAFEGFAVTEPLHFAPSKHPQARLEAITHASGVAHRSVALTGDWQRPHTHAFLGFLSPDSTDSEASPDPADAEPVALIPHRGRYIMKRTASNAGVPLTAGLQDRLLPWGFQLYPGLPQEAGIGPSDVAKLAFFKLRSEWRLIVLMAFAVALLGLLTPILTSAVLGSMVPDGERGLLAQAGAALVLAAVLAGTFSFVQYLAISRVTQRSIERVQPAFWQRTLFMPPKFFRGFSSGDLSVRVMAVDSLQQLVTTQVIGGLLAAVFSLVNLVLMFHYSPALGFAGLGFLLLSLVVMWFGVRAVQRLYMYSITAQLKGTSWVVQLLMGVSKIRLAGAGGRLESKYLDMVREQVVADARMTMVLGRVSAWVYLVLGIAPASFVAIIYAGGSGSDQITSATFLAFAAAFGASFAAMSGLAAVLLPLGSAVPIFRLLQPLMAQEPESARHRTDPGVLRGAISFRDIRFRYEEGSPVVLDGLSFDVAAGEMVALVGPTGSGKSTAVRLLLGFDEPEEGQVLLDGQSLADLDLDLVRRQMGVVIQNSQIMRGSLMSNILGGAIQDEALAWEAAEKAALADDIRAMPMGMRTMVDPNLVSGGQAQRILLARALVREPNIVVMDEATSALDNVAQAKVTESMTNLGATRVVIAHRLSTIKSADRILVIVKGAIVQEGTYEELQAVDGEFARLTKRQLS